MKVKFPGTYAELQDIVLLTEVFGEWREIGNHKQYRAESGAILNWWKSTRTITFQGSALAARALRAAFLRAISAGQATTAAETSGARRLRFLQEENASLKKLLGKALTENVMLKERAMGK
jgi:hypothetical protein